jgi:predicted Fe-Mo cluster-binding NifX family protein
MKVAVASQNRREVTGHAGRCRRFWVYSTENGEILGREMLDLPKEQAFHEHDVRAPHPLDGVRVLITGGMGAGLVRKLEARSIEAVATSERDPDQAVSAWLDGTLERLPAEESHDHAGEHGHTT